MRDKMGAVLFAGLCMTGLPGTAQSNTTDAAATGGYRLVWADEFNKDGKPDTTSWRFEKGFVRNQELQWYQQENAYCKNGFLVIEGRRETKPNPGYEAGSNNWKKNRGQITYTSSSINTSGKFSWQYGRFVMRGRINISKGLWPAWVPIIQQHGTALQNQQTHWAGKPGPQHFIYGGWIGTSRPLHCTWMVN